MNVYYLRCRRSDLSQLFLLGQLLGVIEISAEAVVTPVGAGVWDEIGMKPLPDGTLSGGATNPYWHANFRTEHNLRELAEIVALKQPDVAEALTQPGRFFVTDAAGNVVTPEFPFKVSL